MNVVQGDLLALAATGRFDVMVHGCNCFCTMGAGIAKAIKQAFPEAYAADLKTARGDRRKLGSYSVAHIVRGEARFDILNAYTQFDWRGTGCKADYEAIRQVFARVKADFRDARVGYPLIGAGFAGGDWSVIEQIVDRELAGMDHTLVRLA